MSNLAEVLSDSALILSVFLSASSTRFLGSQLQHGFLAMRTCSTCEFGHGELSLLCVADAELLTFIRFDQRNRDSLSPSHSNSILSHQRPCRCSRCQARLGVSRCPTPFSPITPGFALTVLAHQAIL